jgi:trimeric autotransporter adhesin
MSTKTTFKRIALVAVAALGFGLLTSVAPASAASGAATSLTAGTVGPARVGVNLPVAITLGLPTTLNGTNETMTIGAKVISAPTGSTFNTVGTASTAGNTPVVNGNVTGGRTAAGNLVAGKIGWTSATANLSDVDGANEAATSANVLAGGPDYLTAAAFVTDATYAAATNTTAGVILNVTPDVAGTYTVLVHTSSRAAAAGGSATGAYAAGDTSIQVTFTTGGAPSSIVLTPVNASSTDGSNGALIKVSLKDAAGLPTVLGLNEGLTISDSSSTATNTAFEAIAAGTDTAIGPEDFYAGVAFIRAKATVLTADLDLVVTVTGSGLIPATVVTNTTIKFYDAAYVVDTFALTSTTTGYATAALGDYTADLEYNTNRTSHAFSIEATVAGDDADTTTGADYVTVTVTDTDGVNTGFIGGALSYDLPSEILDGDVDGTISIAGSLGTTKSILFTAGAKSIAMAGAAASQTTTTARNSVVRVATGGSVTLVATTFNQYAGALAAQTVNISVAGRNAATAIAAASDANGQVSITITDAATATGTTSTVTFDAAAGTDATTTIFWGTVAVDTVVVTGGASEDTVAFPAAGATTRAITTASTGANGATTTFTATVKDAAGSLIAGVPVTWTVDKATAAITKTASNDSSTCITGTAGTCTTTVFSWAAPSKVTVTATAGGKTGTGYQNFVNAATDARVLSGTVAGPVVTAKVVDRYGNPVSGVTVKAQTSNGYFGSGSTSVTGVTIEDGTVGFAVQAASATVTLTVDSAVYTQTDDEAGKVGITAVTAAVAGTTTGTGASFAPAGVNRVTVEASGDNTAQAAADAAAEATDAANAATDAANAAAEAADAATAAAQDAADAVAALSTQVTELVSALRKQITSLTNLVIKIQRKVRA